MISQKKLHTVSKAKWQELASSWIDDSQGINRHCREGLLDAVIFNELGCVKEMRILDLGCGDGRFSRLLAQRGAFPTGVDQCDAFIAHANKYKVNSNETYYVGDAHHLTQFGDHAFDCVVSYITFVDFVDISAVVAEVSRVLKKSGKFIVCNMHPVLLCGDSSLKDNVKGKTLFDLTHYFNEGPITFEIYSTKLTSFHRTLSTHIQTFLKNNFSLVNLIEPKATVEQVKKYPGLGDADQLPIFIIYSLVKNNM